MRLILRSAERHAAAVERTSAIFGSAGFDVDAVLAYGRRVAFETPIPAVVGGGRNLRAGPALRLDAACDASAQALL